MLHLLCYSYLFSDFNLHSWFTLCESQSYITFSPFIFESERVFRDFRHSILTSFFHNFWKVWNRKISEFSINLECWETPVFDPKPSKTGFFLTQKQVFLTHKREIISKLISELFPRNFCEFEKTAYFQKNSELRKPNYSKTGENEKFRKFRLLQGLWEN